MTKAALILLGSVLLLAPSLHAQVTPARPTPSPVRPTPAPVNVDCGCEDKPLPELLGLVNGIRITKLDLDDVVQKRIRELQQEVVDARRRELDLQINSILLEAEARKRGTNTNKLLEDEVVKKVVSATEADARAYYDANKAQITREFPAVKDDIIAYLTRTRQEDAAKKLAERLRAAAALKISPEAVTPPASPAQRARVFATVNGKNITSADIEDSLKPLIFNVQETVYRLRRQVVELKINDALLEQEAKKRSITTAAVLSAEVNAKASPITDVDAQKFYDENKARINGEFAQVRPQLIEFLKEQALQKARSDFAARLRSAAQVQVFIDPPTPPVYQVAVDDQPTRGNATATVTIVEFTDFECTSCAKQHPILERLITEYGTRVKFVVRDFPLIQHENANKAAEAAEAAREQGKYWEYTALLYKNQSALTIDKLKQYASTLGLDRARFDAALDSGKFADKVLRDRLDGQRIGVTGAPTIFVNGRRVNDLSYEGLKAAVENGLRNR